MRAARSVSHRPPVEVHAGPRRVGVDTRLGGEQLRGDVVGARGDRDLVPVGRDEAAQVILRLGGLRADPQVGRQQQHDGTGPLRRFRRGGPERGRLGAPQRVGERAGELAEERCVLVIERWRRADRHRSRNPQQPKRSVNATDSTSQMP